jgi:hypothetical protein
VARDQAHRLAAAKTADPDNADANAHGGVLWVWAKENPRSRGLRGFRNAGRGRSGDGTTVRQSQRGRTLIDAQPEEPPLGCSGVGVGREGSGS